MSETATRDLNVIAEEMEGLGESGDLEDSHLRADGLLIETIRRLVDTPFAVAQSDRIIAAWNRLEKWYA